MTITPTTVLIDSNGYDQVIVKLVGHDGINKNFYILCNFRIDWVDGILGKFKH